MPAYASPSLESPVVVDHAIRMVCARIKVFEVTAALVVLATGCVAYLLGVVLADQMLEHGLPLAVRRISVAVVGALLIWGAFRWGVRPAIRRISSYYAARLLERVHPEFRNSVMTALESRYHPDLHLGVVAGLQQAAAGHLLGCDILGAVPNRRIRRSLTVLSASACLFILYALIAPKAVGPSMLRAMGMDVPAPTRTTLQVVAPADPHSVVIGSPVTFEVVTEGRAPREVIIEFSRDGGQKWIAGQRLTLSGMPADPGDGETRRRWRSVKLGGDVAETMRYRVVAGDAVSELRLLEVRPSPRTETPELTLIYPAFTNRKPSRQVDGHLDAVVGTRVEFEVTTNVPAQDGRIDFLGAAGRLSRRLEVAGDDRRTLRGAWTIDGDAEYEVRFVDAFGTENSDPVRYRQRGRPDAPPMIEQTSPSSDGVLDSQDAIEFKARVEDDYGLTSVAVVYESGGRQGRIELTGGEAAEYDVARRIPVASFASEGRDAIRVYFEAADNHLDLRGEPAYQQTQGPVYEFQINPPDEPAVADAAADVEDPAGPEEGLELPGDGKESNADLGESPERSAIAEDASEEGGNGQLGEESSEKGGGKPSEEAEQPDSRDGDSSGKQDDAAGGKGEGDSQGKLGATEKQDSEGNQDSDGQQGSQGEPGADGQPGSDGQQGSQGKPGADGKDREAQSGTNGRQTGQSSEGSQSGEKQPGTTDDGESGEAPPGMESTSKGNSRGDASEGGEKAEGEKGSAAKKDGVDDAAQSGSNGSREESEAGQPSEGSESGRPSSGEGNASESGEGGEAPRKGAPSESDAKDGSSGKLNAGTGGDSGTGEIQEAGGDPSNSDGAKVGVSGGEGDAASGSDDGSTGGTNDQQAGGAPTENPTNGGGGRRTEFGKPGKDQDTGEREEHFHGEGESERLDGQDRKDAGKVVDPLELRRRAEQDPKDLKKLDWEGAEQGESGKAYEKPTEQGQLQKDGGLFPGQPSDDTDGKGGAARVVSGKGARPAGGLIVDVRDGATNESLLESEERRVPAEYRDLLEAYYRSMARSRGKQSR